MSTSLLYHEFGIRGCRHVRTEYIKGRVVRRFRGLLIGGKHVTATRSPSATLVVQCE
jgi:hypothetical protein